jgi:hypothetical protein
VSSRRIHVLRPTDTYTSCLTHALTASHNSVCIVSIIRLQALVAISNSRDPTYDNPPAATWSSIEINVGIICSCLPLLRPLLTRFLPGIFTSRNPSNHVGPRHYATIRGTHDPRSKMDESIMMTKHSHTSSKDIGNDIQVVTDISVKVEGGSGRLSGWRTPVSDQEWTAKEGLKAHNSTETLVRDVGQAV